MICHQCPIYQPTGEVVHSLGELAITPCALPEAQPPHRLAIRARYRLRTLADSLSSVILGACFPLLPTLRLYCFSIHKSTVRAFIKRGFLPNIAFFS